MSNDTTYNGWTNYPTWAVNLWLSDTFEQLVADYIESNEDSDDELHASIIGDYLKDCYEEYYPTDESGPNVDLMTWAVGQVNWTEIAQTIMDDMVD